jgi:hypothetical protein
MYTVIQPFIYSRDHPGMESPVPLGSRRCRDRGGFARSALAGFTDY